MFCFGLDNRERGEDHDTENIAVKIPVPMLLPISWVTIDWLLARP